MRDLTADEVLKRLRAAGLTINLGAGTLLALASTQISEEETERSLSRLIRGTSGTDRSAGGWGMTTITNR